MKLLRKPVQIGVKEKLDLLQDSLTWSAERLREMQWQKLQTLLDHAYNSTEFYRNRFDELGLHPKRDFPDFESLAKLPFLTKQDIRDNYGSLTSSDYQPKDLFPNATGGSTGVPLAFLQDRNFLEWAEAMRIRSWRCHSDVSNDPVEAILWGADRDVGKGLQWTTILRDLFRYRTLQLNTFDLDDAVIKKYFRIFNFVRPEILRGYASSLYFVAQFLRERGIKIRPPKVIVSTAELLRDKMRQTIGEVFGADVIDSYGCREVSQIATECRSHNGMHVAMENQFVEIVDNQLIVTNLNNLGMPFIRYQIGDLASELETSPCTCGRQAFRIRNLLGRDNENIHLPNGKVVNAIFFQFLFFGKSNVEKFQVIYSRSQQKMRIRLLVKGDRVQVEQQVRSRMSDAFGFENLELEFSDQFDLTPTGKFRFVYSIDEFDH